MKTQIVKLRKKRESAVGSNDEAADADMKETVKKLKRVCNNKPADSEGSESKKQPPENKAANVHRQSAKLKAALKMRREKKAA